MVRPKRGARRGFSLLEMAIVVAILGIMAGLAGTYLRPMLPTWRTRRAAAEFAGALEAARQAAMAEGTAYRVRIDEFDDELDNAGPSVGAWSTAGANPSGSASEWDILPLEDGGGDDQTAVGRIRITSGAEDALNWVSIEPLEPEPADNAIVFDANGRVVNGVEDFGPQGSIDVVFVNKMARLEGRSATWRVCVTRGGMVLAVADGAAGCGAAAGLNTTTNVLSTSGGGFTGDDASGWGTWDGAGTLGGSGSGDAGSGDAGSEEPMPM